MSTMPGRVPPAWMTALVLGVGMLGTVTCSLPTKEGSSPPDAASSLDSDASDLGDSSGSGGGAGGALGAGGGVGGLTGARGGAGGNAGGVGAMAAGGSSGNGMPGTGGAPPPPMCPSMITCSPPTPICDLTSHGCVACSDTVCKNNDPRIPYCGLGPLSNACVECTASSQCVGKSAAAPFCVNGACVACSASTDCLSPTSPICSPQKVCTACTSNTECMSRDSNTQACISGGCFECEMASQCTVAGKGVCSTQHTCVQCTSTSNAACSGSTPNCNVATNVCVECTSSANCSDRAKPICDTTTNKCVPCSADKDCSDKNSGGLLLCLAPPAGAGTCVQCRANSDCSAPTPGCAANVCKQCTQDSHCGGTTPICDTSMNKCVPCTTDAQCQSKLGANPGVCMSHVDGHCAVDGETFYVENRTGVCSDTASGSGTSAKPFCSMQGAAAHALAQKLILVRGSVAGATMGIGAPGVSVIGQSMGFIAGALNPAVQITSGDAYLRDLRLVSSGNAGCSAGAGSTLRMEHVSVVSSPGGGILLNGAAFDVRNTIVSGNGPGTSVLAGGILVNSPPAAGPAHLERVTVQNNNAAGVFCNTAITASGVLASGNAGADISAACNFVSCGIASGSCGATP